nr:MAG TPA: hypothetical protein [Caudoviricetes sp.]
MSCKAQSNMAYYSNRQRDVSQTHGSFGSNPKYAI